MKTMMMGKIKRTDSERPLPDTRRIPIRMLTAESDEWLDKYLEENKDPPSKYRRVYQDVMLVKASRVGIREFIDPNSKILDGISMLDRVIFFNRLRKEILESLFRQDAGNYTAGSRNAFFDLSLFTEKEQTDVIFKMDKFNTFLMLEDVKQFVHDNFEDIRSVKDIEDLLEGGDA